MLNWAHKHGVKLFLIELGKPNQNAYIESFNGRFRDECLNEHWFIYLPHAKIIIEAWRKQYNEERPKKALGGLTPKAYAGLLAQNMNRLSTADSKHKYYSKWGNVASTSKKPRCPVILPHSQPKSLNKGAVNHNSTKKNRFLETSICIAATVIFYLN